MISAWMRRVRGIYRRKLPDFWAGGQLEDIHAFCTNLAMKGSGAVRVADCVSLDGTCVRALRLPNSGFSSQQSVGGYLRTRFVRT